MCHLDPKVWVEIMHKCPVHQNLVFTTIRIQIIIMGLSKDEEEFKKQICSKPCLQEWFGNFFSTCETLFFLLFKHHHVFYFFAFFMLNTWSQFEFCFWVKILQVKFCQCWFQTLLDFHSPKNPSLPQKSMQKYEFYFSCY